jgi:serine/threonine-protein kinase
MSADGSGEVERLTESDRNQEPSSWSSDGVLAFVEGRDIWVLRLEGDRKPELFLGSDSRKRWPVFSPDGKWLAYGSDETGRYEVYVRPFPAGEPVYRISTDGGRAPLWSPDGRELFYRTDPTEFRNQDKMMVVEVTTGSTFTRGRPRVLFDQSYGETSHARSYDLTPDGGAFVMITERVAEPDPVTQIHVVLNWTEELKRLVPP